MSIGPKNREEEVIFAIENLKADIQQIISSVMKIKGFSKKLIAEKMECSPACISQMLSEDANLTVESVARIFHALDDEAEFSSLCISERESQIAKIVEHDPVQFTSAEWESHSIRQLEIAGNLESSRLDEILDRLGERCPDIHWGGGVRHANNNYTEAESCEAA